MGRNAILGHVRPDLSYAEVEYAFKAMGRLDARLKDIVIKDGMARITLHTDHRGGPIGLDELIDVAARLEVPARNITLWDVGQNVVEVIVDLEPATPIERPRRLPTQAPKDEP